MIQDLNCIFSGAVGADGQRTPQPITGTTLATNIVDTRLPGTPAITDLGQTGKALYLVLVVGQAFNNLTSLTITLESDSNSSLSASTVHASRTVPLASLTAGAAVVRMPLTSDDWKRYVGVRYTVNGTAPTQGSVTAWLTDAPPSNRLFNGSFTLDA